MGWFRRRRDRPDRDSAAEPERDPAGVEQQLPPIDPRELRDDWLRVLTIVGEGQPPDKALELIRRVNQPGEHTVRLRTQITDEDARALDAVLARLRERHSRQAGLNLLAETVLIHWIIDATGATWSETVQRLAHELRRITGD